MMGAGIAYSAARSGMDVVLKDVSQEAADKGKQYSVALLDKAISRGKMTEEKMHEILSRIHPTSDPADCAGVDTVIEAVFEDPALKNKVFAEIKAVVNPDALLCSNTSTLPITELADGVDRPDDFIGLHFFSPVDKMPLVEIIRVPRPPRRRWPRRSTWWCSSGRPRSWSTTAAASTPRASSAPWSTRAWPCSARVCARCRSSGPRPRPATRSAPCSSPTSSTWS
jgi:hypothetical protein